MPSPALPSPAPTSLTLESPLLPFPLRTCFLRHVAPFLLMLVAVPAMSQTDAPAQTDTTRQTDASRPAAVAAPRPEVRLRTEAAPPGTIWVDGQDAAESTARRHSWYSEVRAEELSGGDWLSHFGGEPAEARYELTVPEADEYHFWVRANPVGSPKTEYRLGDDDWRTIDFSDPVQRVNVAADGTPDLRFIAWVDVGKVDLDAGPLSVRFRFSSKNNHHGAIDAFVFSRTPFTPNYALRPGEKTGRADAGRWAFEPAPDTFEEDALLDLRFLNETPAGKHGFIRVSDDGESFVDGRGEPIRFWSGTTYVAGNGASVEEIERWATFYAKRGINMVRYHGDLVPDEGADLSRVNERALDEIWRLVAGMKRAGIYTTVSPYWGSHTKFDPKWGVADPGGESMTGLLFFEPNLQAAYKSWLRELFTRVNPYTGVPLKDEPALAIFQIQNEDSLLFWTSQRIEGEALGLLQRRFAEWAETKHGTLDAALESWDGHRHQDDNFEDQRVGIEPIWHLTQTQTGGQRKRLADQLAFFSSLMRDFNRMIGDFIRDELDAPHLVNAGNWKTADDAQLLDAERWSYMANETIASNKYFSVNHRGPRSGSAILEGDVYQSRSALRNPRHMPTNVKQPTGHTFVISESQWVPPNRFQSEGPLAVAAYQSLSGLDSFYWFTVGRGFTPPFGKWDTGSPAQMGMFPAAALLFRNGYIREGNPVVDEVRDLDDVWDRHPPLVAEKPGYDPNRDAGDLPQDAGRGSTIDPLAFLTGPVRVRFNGNSHDGNANDANPNDAMPSDSRVADLASLIDRDRGVVRSVTDEITLDHRRGILTVDSPCAQAIAGFLGESDPIQLSDVVIRSGNQYVAVHVVSLDTKPIRDSGNLLIQVGTTARPYGFREQPTRWADDETSDGATEESSTADEETTDAMKITSLGTSPWNLDANDVEILVRGDGISEAFVLDANGYPTRRWEIERRGEYWYVRFPPDTLYVVLR